MLSLLVSLGLAGLLVKRLSEQPVHTADRQSSKASRDAKNQTDMDPLTITRAIAVAMIASMLVWLTPESAAGAATQDNQAPAVVKVPESVETTTANYQSPVLFLGMDENLVQVATGLAEQENGRVTVVLPQGQSSYDGLQDPITIIPTDSPIPVLAPLTTAPTHIVISFDYTATGHTMRVLDQIEHLIAYRAIKSLTVMAGRHADLGKRGSVNALHLNYTASLGALKALVGRCAPVLRAQVVLVDQISQKGAEELASIIYAPVKDSLSSGMVIELSAQGVVAAKSTTGPVQDVGASAPREPVKVDETPAPVEKVEETSGDDESSPGSSGFLSFILRVFGFCFPALHTFQILEEREEQRKREALKAKQQSEGNLDDVPTQEDSDSKVVDLELREQWYTYWIVFAVVCLFEGFFMPAVLQGLLFLPLVLALGRLGAFPGCSDAVLVYAFLLAPAKELVDKAEKAVVDTVGLKEQQAATYSELLSYLSDSAASDCEDEENTSTNLQDALPSQDKETQDVATPLQQEVDPPLVGSGR